MNGTNENSGSRSYSQIFSEAIERRRKNPRIFFRDAITLAVGLLFARCHVVFGARPLAIALLCALPYRVWIALFGCVCGALTLGKAGVIYAMISFVAVFLRLAISGGTKDNYERETFGESGLFRLSVAAISGFTIAAYELLLSGINGTSLLFGLAMIILCPLLSVALSYLFSTRFSLEELLFDSTRVPSLHAKVRDELLHAVLFRISAAAYAFFITLSLKEFELLGVSPSYVFSAAVTLIISKRFGALHGAGVGFASALAISPTACTAFAISGLASGALFRVGLPYALAGGGIALCAWSSYTGGLTGLLGVLPEYVIGAALSYPLLSKLKEPDRTDVADTAYESSKDMVGTMALAYRNKFTDSTGRIAKALIGLSELVCSFADGMEKRDVPACEEILSGGCKELLRLFGDKPEAVTLIEKISSCSSGIAERLASGERLSPALLRDFGCEGDMTALGALCDATNAEFAALEESAVKRRAAIRADDFSALGMILSAAIRSDDAEKTADGAHDEALARVFEECGFSGGTIRAFGDRYKHVIAAGEDSEGLKITAPELKSGIERTLGIKLGAAEYYRRGELVLMEATAKRKFSAHFACAGKDGSNAEISGDTASGFESDDDRFFALVCDGMGSGRTAKSTSAFAADFLESTLSCGCDAEGTLHVLNGIIRAANGECSATVDLFELDLMNCEARFIKCGAAPSYVKRDSSIFRIRSRTAPIGLMRSVDAEKIRVEVRSGDFIIMLSDGICQGVDEAPWLLELISKYDGRSPKELSDRIIAEAGKHTAYGDDMSVVTVKISAE